MQSFRQDTSVLFIQCCKAMKSLLWKINQFTIIHVNDSLLNSFVLKYHKALGS